MNLRRLTALKCCIAFAFMAGIFTGALWKQVRTEPAFSFEVAGDDAASGIAAAESMAIEQTPVEETKQSKLQVNVPLPPFEIRTVPFALPLNKALAFYRSDEPAQPKPVRHVVAKKERIEKPKPEARPRVALSSNNWGQMSGLQRWQFVAAYVKSMHWKCPSSGMSRTDEIAKLSPSYVTWGAVLNMGLNNCIDVRAEQAGR